MAGYKKINLKGGSMIYSLFTTIYKSKPFGLKVILFNKGVCFYFKNSAKRNQFIININREV